MRVAIRYKKNEDDAAALVNDAFLKILINIENYSLDKPLEPWLKRIIINVTIDDFRKNKSYTEMIESVDTQEYENTYKSDSLLDEEMIFEDMLDVINKILPKATRVVFFLKKVDGYSHKEISDKLKITVETSKWHIKNAKKLLTIHKHKLVS